MIPGVVDHSVELRRELFVQPRDSGSIRDVQGDGMHIAQVREVAEIVGRAGCGIDVPASLAQVSRDGQTDSSAGAGDQHGGHRVTTILPAALPCST